MIVSVSCFKNRHKTFTHFTLFIGLLVALIALTLPKFDYNREIDPNAATF